MTRSWLRSARWQNGSGRMTATSRVYSIAHRQADVDADNLFYVGLFALFACLLCAGAIVEHYALKWEQNRRIDALMRLAFRAMRREAARSNRRGSERQQRLA
jgi:hypothetical protein